METPYGKMKRVWILIPVVLLNALQSQASYLTSLRSNFFIYEAVKKLVPKIVSTLCNKVSPQCETQKQKNDNVVKVLILCIPQNITQLPDPVTVTHHCMSTN